jgi:hypothetical protein
MESQITKAKKIVNDGDPEVTKTIGIVHPSHHFAKTVSVQQVLYLRQWKRTKTLEKRRRKATRLIYPRE